MGKLILFGKEIMRRIYTLAVFLVIFSGCSEDPKSAEIPFEIETILKKLDSIKQGDDVFVALQRLGLAIDMANQDQSLVFLDGENPADQWWLFDLRLGDEWLIEIATGLEYERGKKFEDLKYPVSEIGVCRSSVNAWKNDRGSEFGLTRVFPRWWRGKIYVSEKELEAAKSHEKAEQVASWKGL